MASARSASSHGGRRRATGSAHRPGVPADDTTGASSRGVPSCEDRSSISSSNARDKASSERSLGRFGFISSFISVPYLTRLSATFLSQSQLPALARFALFRRLSAFDLSQIGRAHV